MIETFKECGLIVNLDTLISLLCTSLFLRPYWRPPGSGSLNSLANALSMRFEQKGNITDLEESIAFHRQALDLFPCPHPLRSTSLNNLASALSMRFEQKGNLEGSIFHLHEAVHLITHEDPKKPPWLYKLRSTLALSCEAVSELIDISHSIKRFRDVVQLTPDNDPRHISPWCKIESLGMHVDIYSKVPRQSLRFCWDLTIAE